MRSYKLLLDGFFFLILPFCKEKWLIRHNVGSRGDLVILKELSSAFHLYFYQLILHQ